MKKIPTKKKQGIVLLLNGTILMLIILLKSIQDIGKGIFDAHEKMEVFFYCVVAFSQIFAASFLLRGIPLQTYFNYLINILVGLSILMIKDFTGMTWTNPIWILLLLLSFLYYTYEFGGRISP